MSHAPLRSILARLPSAIDHGVELESLKRRGWREHAMAVIDPRDMRLNFTERQIVERLATRLYGPSNALMASNPRPSGVIE